MRKCGTAKPSESTQREMGVHMGPALYGQPSASIYMGSPGGTPPLTLGLPSNYGAPILMQQPTPNNVPYDYSSSISNVTSYNPPPPRPAAYAPPGTVIGGGLNYGAPLLDGYGMNMNSSLGPPVCLFFVVPGVIIDFHAHLMSLYQWGI
jgi:hypothetical protein